MVFFHSVDTGECECMIRKGAHGSLRRCKKKAVMVKIVDDKDWHSKLLMCKDCYKRKTKKS